ncbi:MAG: 50S ribosomal protein L21 [Firmicutes bacterium]|nr:50S ribosomal protein L21 [Bacillota bacterium]
MYAIVVTGGKQYKVVEGDILDVELLDGAVGAKVDLPVLMLSGDNPKVGKDVGSKTVKAEIVAHGKDKKIVVYKYKPKKNVRKKQGHRQMFTRIKIGKIG